MGNSKKNQTKGKPQKSKTVQKKKPQVKGKVIEKKMIEDVATQLKELEKQQPMVELKNQTTQNIKQQLGQISQSLNPEDAIDQLIRLTQKSVPNQLEVPPTEDYSAPMPKYIPIPIEFQEIIDHYSVVGYMDVDSGSVYQNYIQLVDNNIHQVYPVIERFNIQFTAKDMLQSIMESNGVQILGGVQSLSGFVYLNKNFNRFLGAMNTQNVKVILKTKKLQVRI